MTMYFEPLGKGWLQDAIDEALATNDARWEQEFNRLHGAADPTQVGTLNRLVDQGKKLAKLRKLSRPGGRT